MYAMKFQIDWLAMIRDIFLETGLNIDYEERVIVKEMDFLFNIVILLQNTSTETLGIIVLYIHVLTYLHTNTCT